MMSMIFVLMLYTVNAIAFTSNYTEIDKIDSTLIEQVTLKQDSIFADTLTSKHSQELNKLHDLVFSYVSQTSRNSVSNIDKQTIAQEIVSQALTNNIDICFILAQGTIETQLGAAGIGRSSSRHSLFGVMKSFKTYEECISYYVSLLKRSYLTRGRTEYDLMKKYTTTGGTRYAQSLSYETELHSTYHKIKRNTDIFEVQNNVKTLKEQIEQNELVDNERILD